MPGRNKNRELIKEIKEGNEDVLLYLFRKYYGELKKVYHAYNIDEKEIPAHVASSIVKVWMEIHQNNFSDNIELTSYLLNTAKERAEKIAGERKASRKNRLKDIVADKERPEIIAECVSVLDSTSRKALQWSYAENYSIEQVAERLKMDVASAHDFINKAFGQLSSIVKIRMEYSS